MRTLRLTHAAKMRVEEEAINKWKIAAKRTVYDNLNEEPIKQLIYAAKTECTKSYEESPDRTKWALILIELYKIAGLDFQTHTQQPTSNNVNILVMSPRELEIKRELARKELAAQRSQQL